MIGNDVIDLDLAATESNWKRKGYLQKIFAPQEQKLILTSVNPDVMVWLLWSMKEAAYKIESRCTGIRCYAPSKLQGQIIRLTSDFSEGKIHTATSLYHTRSLIEKSMIHTTCSVDKKLFDTLKSSISIHKDQQYPEYHSSKPASVSHHGKYLALVYL